MKMPTVRQRFFAGLGLYLAWVGFLVILALTSATGPPSGPVEDGPVPVQFDTPHDAPAPAGTLPVR
ncbi:MAG: hypothetical protein ACYC61_20400 [Isosphaeraceae bacterium]